MDNYNALSKSAILTKLALDGYFIDLLTLNSFIKQWQIEAIYENEFGIEFFDNSSYLAILNNLKDKYNKTKQSLEGSLKEQIEAKEQAALQEKANPVVEENTGNGFSDMQKPVSLDDLIDSEPAAAGQENIPVSGAAEIYAPDTDNAGNIAESELPLGYTEESSAKEAYTPEKAMEEPYAEPLTKDEDSIMPSAMKNLKPGPVSIHSNMNADDSCDFDIAYEEESFTQEEIEKADSLINGAPDKEAAPQSIETAAQSAETAEQKSGDELDLMELAHSFAEDLTENRDEETQPADLEKIFDNPSAEQFEHLQDYVEENPPEYKSLKEDFPSDIIQPEIQPQIQQPLRPEMIPGTQDTKELTAQNVRDIIREEISRQTQNAYPALQNGENIKDIIREIVKQTTEVAPQNAFKLDISNQTLDMIAKSIAKKIAVKLNDYYKLNSTKQNAKLQMFREKTIELKEKNQALSEENKKLKVLLLETNRNLNSYKPTIFGLFRFESKKKRR